MCVGVSILSRAFGNSGVPLSVARGDDVSGGVLVFFGHIWRRHGAKYFCSRKAVAMFFGLPCRSRCGGCYAPSFALGLFSRVGLVVCLCAFEVPRWWLASVLLIYKGCGYLQVL